jgi:TonB family protein
MALAAKTLAQGGGFSHGYAAAVFVAYGLATERGDPPQLEGSIVMPEFPYKLQRADIAGEVSFEFVIGEDGRPEQITIVKTRSFELGKAILPGVVEEAIRRWKFVPLKSQKEKFSAPVKIRGVFKFDPNPDFEFDLRW